ncbi:MAG TPA: IS110 family transposase, partial [Myxococcaceae bacterium]|nr:IS110 family transposase [Myxococcaceae bacterium]
LDGRIEPHHQFLLRLQLRRLRSLEQDITTLDSEIDIRLEPYATQHRLLMTIPGIDRVAAAVLIAEIGTDMTAFLSADHLASWVGVCPGSNESAGKRRSGKTRKGNAHLRAHLVQAATCAARTRGTYYRNKYWRLKARRGAKRAQVALAHKILVACYHMLRNATPFRDLGETYLDALARKRTEKQLTRRLEALGYRVTLVPAA